MDADDPAHPMITRADGLRPWPSRPPGTHVRWRHPGVRPWGWRRVVKLGDELREMLDAQDHDEK